MLCSGRSGRVVARTTTRVSVEQQARLDALRQAQQNRHRAEQEYRAAMIAARDSAVTMQAMADTLGVRRESVRQYLERNQDKQNPA